MTDLQLYTELSALPSDLKKQAEDFIKFLKTKTQKTSSIKSRKFGVARGFFNMQDNFDEPLEDFKEYM